jgi:hypothetical protein
MQRRSALRGELHLLGALELLVPLIGERTSISVDTLSCGAHLHYTPDKTCYALVIDGSLLDHRCLLLRCLLLHSLLSLDWIALRPLSLLGILASGGPACIPSNHGD